MVLIILTGSFQLLCTYEKLLLRLGKNDNIEKLLSG